MFANTNQTMETIMKTGKSIAAFVILSCFNLAWSVGANAQDAGLYEAPPPDGTSYVRFLNRSKLQSPVVRLSGVAYAQTAAVISDYNYVKEGAFDVEFNADKISTAFQAGRFYTVVIGDGAGKLKPIDVVEDKGLVDPSSHSGLYFYNYATLPVDLQVNVNGKSGPVFKAVTPGSSEFKEVKPFQVAFEVVADGKVVASISERTFVRGNAISIIVTDSDGAVLAESIDNSVAQ
jgi:Alginate O-acetyl transferase AlgF